LPCGTEFLDLISPQYIADLVSWGAIGARNHGIASRTGNWLPACPCPVGFQERHRRQPAHRRRRDPTPPPAPSHFVSITKSGHVAVFQDKGQRGLPRHLRGGKQAELRAQKPSTPPAAELASPVCASKVMIGLSQCNRASSTSAR